MNSLKYLQYFLFETNTKISYFFFIDRLEYNNTELYIKLYTELYNYGN